MPAESRRWFPRCGYCRKRTYPSRRAARRVLRNVYPGAEGRDMNVYRAVCGDDGWHIGHRDPLFAPPADPPATAPPHPPTAPHQEGRAA